jgi:RNA polymerase sigma-70 factor (ECF subfamily)
MGSTVIDSSKRKTDKIAGWVELYTKDLLSWAFHKTSDKMLAEDLVQQIFLIASEKYASFKEASTAKSWLFAILNNKIAEHYRKLSTRP